VFISVQKTASRHSQQRTDFHILKYEHTATV